MTSTEVTTTPRLSITETMAAKFGMAAGPFEATLRATVFPSNASREQFAAFLLVANQYGLNPVTREIYAFPGRSGGIQPIVSIDGWINIINSHPQMNGLEFDDHIQAGQMTAVTARIWRKDREKPIQVTEYLSECDTGTATWKKYPCRMLRHKALIQCARYAFGFAGIVDPDEAERIEAAQDVTSKSTIARVSGAAAYERFAGNSRAAEVRRSEDEPAEEQQESGPAAAGTASADDAGPPPAVPLADLQRAWQRGKYDKEHGRARSAVPVELRKPERAAEALAWAKGWVGEPLDPPPPATP